MPKQIKIGFDKTLSPVTDQFPQLVDIEGNLLFDEAGNPLLTEEEGSLVSFARAENSTSTHLNNDRRAVAEIVPVTEVFPEQSAVSTNLLGYNRAEVQLSLFSDVSTYGLDTKNWDYYTYSEGLQFPRGWYTKEDPVYGERTQPRFEEETREQALLLKSFPTQYSFPFGRSWDREGFTNRFNEELFIQYVNFIAMGKYLYDIFAPLDIVFAEKNLIGPNINIVPNYLGAPTTFLPRVSPSFGSTTDLYNIAGLPSSDINYGDNEDVAFDQIERWTAFWNQIIDDVAVFPQNPANAIVDFAQDPRYINDIQPFARVNTRPGYSDTRESFAILESKNSFRYQPGRASGFTFGTRLKTDAASLNNTIEWGAANDTDEYMFQLKGSQFNIIRRSVIPLPTSLLERMGVPESDVNEEYIPVSLGNNVQMQEVVFARDRWNGDRLNGTGPSGYTLQFENVTMYKIEFSWYGAVGAKFYAYVPADNGEARWVLMHTLVIENGMGNPILKNADFKFRYLVYSDRTSSVTEPFFIYKYGSSYYIDGGDEGTVRLSTVTSDSKEFTTRTPVIGVLPKTEIISSYQGTEVVNRKKLYPMTVSVNSTQPVRIDIEQIQGSSDGFHHHYSPSLSKERIGPTANLVFNSTGTVLTYANNSPIEASFNRSKIIADGVYNVYIDTEGNILRRSTDGVFDFILQQRSIANRTRLNNGQEFEPRGSEIEARFSETTYVASDVPINAEQFKIHFLVPQGRDGQFGSRHFADFLISFSEDAPLRNVDGDLVFGELEQPFVINGALDERLFVEWTQLEERNNSAGLEELEWEPGYGDRFEIDARQKPSDLPKGEDGGRVGAINGTIETFDIEVDQITPGTGEFVGLFKILFDANASVPQQLIVNSLGTGEIGVNGISTGIRFAGPTGPGDERVFVGTEGNPTQTYVYVDGNPPGDPTAIQLRSLVISSAWELDSLNQNGNPRFRRQLWRYNRVFSFNLLPLYLVIGMRDGAELNNIVVEEIHPDGTVTHTPNWITGDNSGINIINSGGAIVTEAPSNFESETRLQGSRFDTQTTQPMRPGEVLFSFFVDANKPTDIDLTNIFDFDRQSLSTGIYNNRAIFFTANQLTLGGGGNVEMALTVKEQ